VARESELPVQAAVVKGDVYGIVVARPGRKLATVWWVQSGERTVERVEALRRVQKI